MDTRKQNTASFVITKEAATMGDMLFFLILAGAAGMALGLAFLLFDIFLYIVYKLTGGRLDLISYLEKL